MMRAHWALAPVAVRAAPSRRPALLLMLCAALIAFLAQPADGVTTLPAAMPTAKLVAMPTAHVVIREGAGGGFQCAASKIKPEWEKAIAFKCAELASLLHAARAHP
jgi:hypothetical protein